MTMVREAQLKLLKGMARSLWPTTPDLNPRTRREDAMLDIMCTMVDSAAFGTIETVRDFVGAGKMNEAIKVLDDYMVDPDPADGYEICFQLYKILKG